LKIRGIPFQLNNLFDNLISNRLAYCKVNKIKSELFEVNHGTIQRSILGPMLFALFISLLADITSPTDDNYLFGSEKTDKKVLECCIKGIAMKMFFRHWLLCQQKKERSLCLSPKRFQCK
jgi:hypothetical protein